MNQIFFILLNNLPIISLDEVLINSINRFETRKLRAIYPETILPSPKPKLSPPHNFLPRLASPYYTRLIPNPATVWPPLQCIGIFYTFLSLSSFPLVSTGRKFTGRKRGSRRRESARQDREQQWQRHSQRTGEGVSQGVGAGRGAAQILLNPHNCDNGALFVISGATL